MSNIIRENRSFEVKYFNEKDRDLYITDCGYEKCLPKKTFGPAVRNYFLIHFVIEGKGIYKYNGKEYEINENEGFVIFPKDSTIYTADNENPWYYYWVGFNGIKARQLLNECSIDKSNPVIKCSSNLIKKYIMNLYNDSKAADFNDYTMIGYLYLFLSCLKGSSIQSNKERLVQDAISFIKNNFMYEIKIENLSKKLFVERSYLYRLFMQSVGMSPLEYLVQYRLNIACELLKYTNHNITDIANYVGFSNSSSFCKAFRKEYNITPLKYRNSKVHKII